MNSSMPINIPMRQRLGKERKPKTELITLNKAEKLASTNSIMVIFLQLLLLLVHDEVEKQL